MKQPEATSESASSSTLGVEEFAELFGIPSEGFSSQVQDLINQSDFRYRVLSGLERDRVLVEVLNRTDSGEFSEAGRENKEQWETAWGKNLDGFRRDGKDLSSLLPTYYSYQQPILRLYQDYVMPANPNFQLNWFKVFQRWLFTTYFKGAKTIYEFGCGSGINLAALAELYPEKRYVGLDWTEASKQIVDEMASARGWNMEGRFFDFFAPDKSLKLDEGSVVLTVHALEQIGHDYEAFLQYLLEESPALCVHIEPVVEWFDDSNLVDYAAIRCHKKRKYLEGFPNRLKELERDGRVEIIKTKRSFFGTLFGEGYSQIIWRPVSGA